MPSLGIVHRARRTMSETFTHGSRWRRVYRRATDECEVPPLDIGIQAIQLSPYRAGVAGPCHTRLLTSPAFPSCSCSLSFQNQVRRVASESSALNSGPLQGRFTPCVPWRTVSSSSGFPSLQTVRVISRWRVYTRLRSRATLGLDVSGHTF
jgi:hypothetical protein